MADAQADLLALREDILTRMRTGVAGTSFGDMQVRYDLSNLPVALADVDARLAAMRSDAGIPVVTTRVSFTRINMRRC